jgi:hypothetical protein
VASYDGATLKVTELFSKVILLPMFVYRDCMAVCTIFIHLPAMGVAEIAKSTNLKWCSHTFVYIVYYYPWLQILRWLILILTQQKCTKSQIWHIIAHMLGYTSLNILKQVTGSSLEEEK